MTRSQNDERVANQLNEKVTIQQVFHDSNLSSTLSTKQMQLPNF